MKLALVIGNRYNPWHLRAFTRLAGAPEITVFRAESQIQAHFDARDDGSVKFAIERLYFDTQVGPPLARLGHILGERYAGRQPRVVPFHERLKHFDIVQSWELFTDWSAEAVQARERYGTRLALMVWDNIPFNMEAGRSGRAPGRRALKRRAIEAADRIVVYTERSRRMLAIEGAPMDRVALAPPGVDVEAFAPAPANRASLGLEDGEYVILFVGWFVPRKGLDFLLFALSELVRDPELRATRFRLVMVGEGAGKERIEALIQRLNLERHCLFLGARPYNRMPEVFRAADAFVLPSIASPEWQEQFGMSLLEAMACGVPVVGTMSGAIPEIAGQAGVLVQPNDFVALHAALKGLALDPGRRHALAAAGRARVLERFTLEHQAAALSDLYAGMLR